METGLMLQINNDQLRLSSSKSDSIDSRDCIYLDNVLGFEELENGDHLIKGSSDELTRIAIEIIDFFENKDVQIEVDDGLNSLISIRNKKNENYEKSKDAGAKIKISPPDELEIPNFKRTLKKYQIGATAHMVSIGNSANFSVPGSGKTTITLAAYAIWKAQNIVESILVIGPRAAFMPWEDEYFGCFEIEPYSVRIAGPSSERKKLHKEAETADMVLMSYQMVAHDQAWLSEFLIRKKILMVLDESHYIKKLHGGTWSTSLISLAPFATKRIILSGTPVPNSLEDLWSQMTFLWPDTNLLGTSEEYRDRVSNDTNALEGIREDLFPFYWRIPKSELKLMPPKIEKIIVEMKPLQKAIYDVLAVKILSELERLPVERRKLRNWRRARTIRLLQTASNPALLNQYSEEFQIPPIDATGLSVSEIIDTYPSYEVPSKIEALIALTIQLLEKGEKVLVWTSFVHNIKTVEKLLTKYQPRIVYGDIPKDENDNEFYNREKMIREFKYSNEFNLLIANPSACAESISLHKVCHHAIYLDRTFNCAQFTQSLDRIHRIGLAPDEQVYYYFLMSKNSIDQVIDDRLIEKQKRMFEILKDDFALLNLETSVNDYSDLKDEEEDFAQILKQLRRQYN